MSPTFNKPIVINAQGLRVLPNELQGSACALCDKRQAVWEMVAPGVDAQMIVCSFCYLYHPSNAEMFSRLPQFIEELEKVKSRVFPKNPDGRLTEISDANGILSALVMTSRIFQMRGRR